MAERAYERYWSAPLSVDVHLDRLDQVYGLVMRDARSASRPAGRPGLHGTAAAGPSS